MVYEDFKPSTNLMVYKNDVLCLSQDEKLRTGAFI